MADTMTVSSNGSGFVPLVISPERRRVWLKQKILLLHCCALQQL